MIIMALYNLDKFREFEKAGLEKGFRFVESSPLVRSSYHAEKQASLLPVSEV